MARDVDKSFMKRRRYKQTARRK